MAKQSPTNQTQLMDAPLPKRKKYKLNPMNPVDAIVSDMLHDNPPAEGEAIYASPRLTIFHGAKGETRQFLPVKSLSPEGRVKALGGVFRTSDPDDIAALDNYCVQFSGEFRKIYPHEV